MTDTITNEERRCLQMWFRQAIAKLELEEVTNVMLKEFPVESEEPKSHRTSPEVRRTSRSKVKAHVKELMV
jgi:hypothetical protein